MCSTDDHDLICVYAPELPEPIIHRMQSLLTSKKAAQTALLTKSWHGAYSTRPTIDLDESHFPDDPSSYGQIDGLVKYATKTFRRYEESNLRINTFRLSVEKDWYGYSGLATKWTLKALKLGATDLTFRLARYSRIAIPLGELFGSGNVVRLCLQHSIISRLKVVNCQRLKSLTLSHVYISSDLLFDIILCCPLIENLSLSHIYTNSDDENDDEEYELHGFQKLTSLVMCLVEYKIQKLLLDALSSSKFPNLKELTLRLSLDGSVCRGAAREIQIISSHSLEILNFAVAEEGDYSDPEEIMRQRVELDVPGIRKFTYEGKDMPPNLYFRSTMDQWEESRVSLTLTRHDGLGIKWFFELSKFITKLRLSKIHLCLHLHKRFSHKMKKSEYQEGDIKSLNAHDVEDLAINNKCLPSLSFNALLDGLFRICRPKMISQYVSPPPDDINDDEMSDNDGMSYYDDEGWNPRNNDIFLCRALKQVMKVKSLLLPTHFKHGFIDLDEVIAQKLFGEVWKPQPMDSILDVSTSEQRRFRFQLKWKSI